MYVETILQAKGTTVFTLPETATLAEAVAMLNAHNIGALVITGSGDTVVGILSERDIVRQLGTDPAAALARSVRQIMTADLVTCTRDTPIDHIMDRMTRRRVRHMPVLDGTSLVGIVSIGDVVKIKIEEVEHEAEALRDYIAS
ncbi:CBS domain-containing protein [Devosia sp. FJ2-5-3]|uniref:CBS domain-containing protein n=1 Tax=Devosia sp. FJ2-5-3 TaxID=2976680 RepID=UPI0023D7C0DC|nr:CBS domain-containing protein [Devosia sp. FJ2-5-3]WEJ59625.1 CBS domain-containing protein [Devosia sp. FJ2-5-3]